MVLNPGSSSHRSREFIEFLKLLDAAYPAHTAIKLILDNHSAHISKETKAWLVEQPAGRFEFTFTPKQVGEHCCDQLQAPRDRRNRVSRYAVDSVLDEHADRPVLCLGGVLSDRHVDVEFPPHDALCCSAGANWPMNDTALGNVAGRPFD